MKTSVIIGLCLALLQTAEIRAGLSDKPHKIQSLVKKLFNLSPDPAIAHNLAKPVKLNPREELVEVNSKEIAEAEDGKLAYYDFKNATISISRSEAKKQNSHYTQLICDFHQQLTISQSIDPPNLEIKGFYEAGRKPNNQPPQYFLVKQFDGRITYKIMSNGIDSINLGYSSQELKFGPLSNTQVSGIRAIGNMVSEINNRTALDVDKNTNLSKKIKDFESVFPFLAEGLSPLNKTTLRSQDENSYSINNTIPEHSSGMSWMLSYVVIRGLNNFKQVKITATDEATSSGVVRFHITLITNKLAGYFEWQFNNSHLMVSSQTENFTIDNLTLTAETRFEKNWVLDNVNIDLGRLNIKKAEVNKYPDINVFAYDIFHENLDTLIKRHMKELIHAEFSPPVKADITTTSTRASVNFTSQTTANKLNHTRKVPKKAPKTTETDICDDTRWWFQKPFIRNECTLQ